jgi:CubicO group peptidase (beta-lactamase class C family)
VLVRVPTLRSLTAVAISVLFVWLPLACPLLAAGRSTYESALWTWQEHRDLGALETVVAQELKETNTPGCAVAVVSEDRVVLAKGFGTSNVETGAPVTPEMLFRIGSTSKMYTTYALVALAKEGKLDLNQPIGKYVTGLSPRLSQVTAHQLMSHSAGMRDEAPAYGLHDESALASTVRSWKDDYLFTEPGQVMSYSNPGLTLAGFLVQELSGKPFADVIAERLFKPLGMSSTTFRPTEAMTRPLSQGHNAPPKSKAVVVRPFADNAGFWPAGFMFSSVLDLSRFAIAFLNEGRIDGKQVLDPEVLAKIATGYVDAPSFPGAGKYGYGMMVHEFRGVKIVEHGGSIDGFGCLFKMAPAQKFAVIILANKSGQSMEKSAEKAMELFLPLKPKAEEETKDLPIDASEISDLVGTYAQLADKGLKIEFVSEDGKLIARFQGMKATVKKTARDSFELVTAVFPQPLRVVAVRGADGKIAYIHGGGRALKKQLGGK